MIDITHLPPAVQNLVRKGQSLMDGTTREVDAERSLIVDRMRIAERRWNNLISEARRDIDTCLWDYVDWAQPQAWLDTYRLYLINTHSFVVRIPEFCPLAVVYRVYQSTNEWSFARFEIESDSGYVVTCSKYLALSKMLATAADLRRPHPRLVRVDEIVNDSLRSGEVTLPMMPAPWQDWETYCG